MINMKQQKTILLVEDDANDVELTTMALTESNISNPIVVVRDGQEALDYLYCQNDYVDRVKGNPVAVLLDLKMPKVTGYEVLDKVKKDDNLKSIPIIIMTSSKEEKDLVQCYNDGANAYVVKPVDFEQFTESVKRLGLFWAVVNELPSQE